MKLSIITPSFNQGRFIERTILSVLNQSISPDEFLIFDGGSTDTTIEILSRYEDRVKWISEADRGQAHAVNKGLKAASGEIYGWINSDDIYYPGAFHAVMECFRNNPNIHILYGNANHITENDEVIEPYYTEKWDYNRLQDICFICQPTVFFRRTVIDECGMLNEDLRYCMDYEYWLRIGRKYRFHLLPQFMAGSRLYKDNKTLNDRVAVHNEIGQMLKKSLGKVPSRWVFNYAHAKTDERGLDRSDPWMNIRFTCSVAAQSTRKFWEWNRSISLTDLEILVMWIAHSVKSFVIALKG